MAVIGIGTNSRARLELHILPSPQAVTKFNGLLEQGKKAGALIHITC